jgi:hypothetical protein
LFFVTASDMWHPYGDLTQSRSVLDRDSAANTCQDIVWDDRRWNGCATSPPSYGALRPLSSRGIELEYLTATQTDQNASPCSTVIPCVGKNLIGKSALPTRRSITAHSAKALALRRGRNEHCCANTDRSLRGSNRYQRTWEIAENRSLTLEILGRRSGRATRTPDDDDAAPSTSPTDLHAGLRCCPL